MIPNTNKLLTTEITVEEQPSKNYKMLLENDRVRGYCDKKEAMKQVIYKIINTERYEYQIYDWDYGVELADLFGQPVSYVCSEVERRLKEALMQDDRIENCSNFKFSTLGKGVLFVTFSVSTKFGELDVEKEINY